MNPEKMPESEYKKYVEQQQQLLAQSSSTVLAQVYFEHRASLILFEYPNKATNMKHYGVNGASAKEVSRWEKISGLMTKKDNAVLNQESACIAFEVAFGLSDMRAAIGFQYSKTERLEMLSKLTKQDSEKKALGCSTKP